MQRPFSFASSVLRLVVLGLLAVPTTTALAGKKQNSKMCPFDPLPDHETASGLLYFNSSLESFKFKKPAAVFSFILSHRDVELDLCEELEVPDACCATNKAQFVSVTLQLDPERCATRKALKGLKVRIDGQIIPNRHVAVKAKAATVTIKRLPRIFVNEGDFDIGYDHSLDLIFPRDTECTYYAFQGRDDAWPCPENGCNYLAVTTVDEPSDKSKSKNDQGRLQYPKINATDCCVSVGTSKYRGDDFITTPSLLGVGPPAGTSWCAAGTDVDKDAWDVRILSVGDWGASTYNHDNLIQQKAVAKGMAAVADDCAFERIINVGDNFYEHGLLGGRKIPFLAQGFRKRFKLTWSDIYHGAYSSLQNLVWYGTYGNHDIGMFSWPLFYPFQCYAPTGQTWTHEQCLTQVDCCASPLWQTTKVVNDTMWVLEPGEYAVNVSNPNAAPNDPPLIEFFFLDSNPYIDDYFPDSVLDVITIAKYNQRVPGGLNEWREVRNQTMDSFLSRIENSNATWKIPVIHTSLATWGKHCGFGKNAPNTPANNPDDPLNNKLDQNDCQYFVDLRRDLLNMGIRLTVHGHDHSQQFVKLPAGYDGTSGGKDMYVLTTGAGAKQESVAPGPADMQLWPVNACGGGTPCLPEKTKGSCNTCAEYKSARYLGLKPAHWSLNREVANVGFSSLHVNTTHLMVRVFEKWEVTDGPGLAPNGQLVEVVQEVLTL